MRWATLGVAIAALGFGCGAQDPPVRVALEVSTVRPVVGQPVPLRLRVAYDAAFFATRGLPVLQRRVDLPFCLELGWREAGFEIRWEEPQAGPRVVVDACEVRAERVGESLVLRAEWTPERAGTFSLPAPRLRYAYTTGFRRTLFGDREPVDRLEAVATGSPLEFVVLELPAAGRPPDFCGAVGEFDVRVEAPSGAELGDAFELALVVTGRGDLDRFDPIPWPELPGFAVQGMRQVRTEGERRFVFEVLALREGARLPPLRFSFFSPAEGAYRTLAASPPPWRVAPRRADRALDERIVRLIERARPAIDPLVWWGGGLLLLGAFAALAVLAKRRR